ncbi:sensor histidine kinase [Paenibacillus beijingensis]|uniref:histidine kinase n=1 Tax=Paenibacillus beijingensis TaxID=1126833 RepID=A0A0D5NKF9_9BACL|nr:HAMP domain-containing sensor histidine kinase [Paenibacillus beijingensis]AJY75834.1 histidine kinase [Paenibacillus beijingensis]
MPIRYKLTLWYSCILTAVLIIIGIAVYAFLSYSTVKDIKGRINGATALIAQQFSQSSVFDPDSLIINPDSLQNTDIYTQIIDYRRINTTGVSSTLPGNLRFPFPNTAEKAVNAGSGYVKVNLQGYPFYIYQAPVYVEGTKQVIGYLQVGVITSKEDKLLNNLKTILIFSSLIGLVIAFTIGLLMARQSLRPIEVVIDAAKQIEKGSDLSVRISHEGPNDELGRLTDTLNGMLGRLETAYNELDEAYEAQRRFVSDASHELRTPLTTIRGNIELLQRMWLPALQASNDDPAVHFSPEDIERAALSREAMGDISDEAKRMSRLVNDLLALARADAGYVMEKEPVELLPLVEEVARRASHLPRKAEWRVGDLSVLENVGVNGHPDFLRQLLFIFIENGFKYTTAGYVELQAVSRDRQAGIIIRDTGIGMKSEQVPNIFERFYRADESRGRTGGTGLGLSIAKWIIDEHKGSVEVRTQEGMGTTFTIWLPIAFSLHYDSGIMEEQSRNLEK